MKVRRPLFLLAGGQWRKPSALEPVLRVVLSQARVSLPGVAYVGAANGDDPDFFNFFKPWLIRAGAGRVSRILLARENADLALARRQLRAADAVFVSGGDVEAGMHWLRKYKLRPLFESLLHRDVLFFGISAGSILLGTHWVSWADPRDDASAVLFPCLGLAPVLCDTHAEEDDWEELKTAVRLLGPGGRGCGIPSGGALRVHANRRIEALGLPAVMFRNRRGVVEELQSLSPGKPGA